MNVGRGMKHIMYSCDRGGVSLQVNSKRQISHLTKLWAEHVETSPFTYPASLMKMNMSVPKKIYVYSNLTHQVKFNEKDQIPIIVPQSDLNEIC